MSGVMATVLYSMPTLVLDISNTASPNIPALLSAAGWVGVSQKVIVVNNDNVNTLVFPASLAGADITLKNSPGKLIGGVKNGGTGLKTQVPIKVDNSGATIAAGGTAGRPAPTASFSYSQSYANGAGAVGYGGAGGNGQGFDSAGSLTIVAAQPGSPGTSNSATGLNKINGVPIGTATAYGGNGGAGGGWGAGGGNSDNSGVITVSGEAPASRSGEGFWPGWAAGYAVDGNSLITWINTGTRLGQIK